MPKYTFLLPAFKAKYLAEMLESIKNQTYTDFKVLISDDCSPEPIREVCEPYLSDPRFTYRRNAENMGCKSLVAHWNLLVDLCDTSFLIMASDDDIYVPTFLEEIDHLQQKYPEVDLLRGRVQQIDENGIVTRRELISDEFTPQVEFIHFLASKSSIHCLANYVFRTDRLRADHGFIDFPVAWYSDDATVIHHSYRGALCTSKVLFIFRSSTINISSRMNNSPLSSWNKAKAGMCFVEWIEEEINVIKQDDDVKDLLPDAIEEIKRRACGISLSYLHYVSFKNFRTAIHFFERHKLIGTSGVKSSLIKSWIVQHLG